LVARVIVLLDSAACNFVVVADIDAGHAADGPFDALVVTVVDKAGGGAAADTRNSSQ
jgi:hypothetical protein